MKISINELKTDRQWRSATGYNQARFSKLLAIFESKYTEIFGDSIEVIRAKSPMDSVIENCEELLFFTLFSLKSGLTYDVLGLVTGMDGSTAKRNQELGLKVLKEALLEEGVAPKREFRTVAEFKAHFEGCDELILDGTEQRIERPQDGESQKENYSGKKKTHTVKAMLISAKDKVIRFISRCWVGCMHDFSLLKEELCPAKGWFKNFKVRLDLGFIGFDKLYACKEVILPQKKKKHQPLTEEEKKENKEKAKERIYVEHSISGLKRYRILSDRLRMKDFNLYDDILEVCAGLWNFYLAY